MFALFLTSFSVDFCFFSQRLNVFHQALSSECPTCAQEFSSLGLSYAGATNRFPAIQAPVPNIPFCQQRATYLTYISHELVLSSPKGASGDGI